MSASLTGLLVWVERSLSAPAFVELVGFATSNLQRVLGTTLGDLLTREMGITSPFCAGYKNS